MVETMIRSKGCLTRCGIVLSAILTLASLAGSAAGQMSLRDIARQDGFEWLIGRWAFTASEDQTIQMEYRWELDGHMITIDFALGSYAYHGIVFRQVAQDTVVEYGADNRGLSVQGVWEKAGQKILTKTQRTEANGNTQHMAIYLSAVADDTMKVEVYPLQDGQIAAEPLGVMEYRRQPAAPEQKEPAVKETTFKIGSKQWQQDVIPTSQGDLQITFIGHGTLMFAHNRKVIHVDPWNRLADYSQMPKADLILITHEHGDHLDAEAVAAVRTEKTQIVLNQASADQVPGGIVMKNGDVRSAAGISIEAVPAYNIQHKRPDSQPYHPQGIGNGYILTFGDQRVYVAGDTEDIPEMKDLKKIDIAFLPMNLPYTMTPEMVARAARLFGPAVVYPYHYGQTDPNALVDLLQDAPTIKVRIRELR
ncbi:MAG: MBL fold metallo-hydrolase [Sedimentisphaerales bacterium]|nr:MBL fold metallo-hydrolase [Sedimentisphaerales bacterium]